jgi:hypothetical protein
MKRALQITGYVLAFTARLTLHLVVCAWQFARSYGSEHPWPERTTQPQSRPDIARGAKRPDGARVHTVAGRKIIGRSVTMDQIAEESF